MVIAHCCIFRPRCFFLFLCYLQLLTLILRQTFDFFGHLWLCILVNFFTILIVIIGIFGGHQYRPGYISIYLLWQLINITWNVFIICFYLEIGPYTQSTSGDYNLVNLGTGSRSWFEANGPLCNAIYNVSNLTDHLQLIKPVQVNGCYLDYRIIECVQAGLQILFAINTFFISFFLIYSFSRKPYSTANQYNQGFTINGHASIDAALPPYTISNTIQSRPSVVQRSIRSVQSQSIRKNTNRSSTRSTKSHRATRRSKHSSNHLPSYSSNSNYQANHNYSSNPYNTLNSQSNYNNNGYNTYKSIKSYASNHSNAYKQYNSTTQLQPDSSSVDSLTLYGAQTNQAYYESKYSLHKDPLQSQQQQQHQQSQPNYTSSSNQISHSIPTTPMQQRPAHDYYDTTPPSANNNSMNNNYDSNNQSSSNYYSQTPVYQKAPVQHSLTNNNHQQHNSIYNVYSSNPYNTYGRSTGRHTQRPSSFSSTASCSSLMDNMVNNSMVNNNPNGAASSNITTYNSHAFENVNLRGSPIYMNSETRI